MAWTSSESRPAYLGRGRGRGLERSFVTTKRDKSHHRSVTSASVWTRQLGDDVETKKDRISHVGESRDAVEEETEDGDQIDDIVSRLLQSYAVQTEGEEDSVGSLKQKMNEVVASGAASCLICYSAVKRANPVWSCSRCHCMLHLQCIQQWAKDSTEAQQRSTHTKLFPGHAVTWTCPKCRLEYQLKDIPSKYLCHCGKKVDPPNDPWLLPHSCGEVCRKALSCGHLCSLLCHPGSCPPCPKTVSVACFCRKGGVQVRRCSSQGWSCGRICRKVLACGLHTCEEYCHDGSCRPCGEYVEQNCVCGKESRQIQCGTESWHCSNLCGAALPCGKHFCDKICHTGSCGDCPKSGSRTCPCGKSAFPGLPCTEETPTCGDTCGKALPCGEHYCMQRCHSGDCEACRQLSVKVCRCGKKKKSVLCSSEYLCDVRCTKLRQCGSHQCKRKCCDDNCPPCEQTCNKTLSCRKHKCAAPCHLGPCYPCSLTVDVKCACGKASITVSCGCERETDPPKCMEKCRIPPSCHHRERKPHRCHFGPCPPCRQPCLKPLSCGHTCSSPCHSEPPVKQTHQRTQSSRRKGPPPVEEVALQPCPPCTHPVPVSCFGGHETSDMKCSEAREHSCGQKCGRVLKCGNHTCQKECHTVTNPPQLNEAGDSCDVCEEPCTQPRPSGCAHACPYPCHPGTCPDCAVQMKFHCHCELFTMVVKCSDWITADDSKKKKLLTCSGSCPKLLPCGHSCSLTCHPGACADVCRRRVTLRCPCKRLKKEVRCCEVAATNFPCDKDCLRILAEMKEKQRQEEKARSEEEERLRQEELEAQKLLQRGKKQRKRKWRAEEENEEVKSLWSWIGGRAIFLAIVSILLAFIIWLGYERL